MRFINRTSASRIDFARNRSWLALAQAITARGRSGIAVKLISCAAGNIDAGGAASLRHSNLWAEARVGSTLDSL